MEAASASLSGTGFARWAGWIAAKVAFWAGLALCLYAAFTPNPPKVAAELGDILAHLGAFAYLTIALFAAHFPASGPGGTRYRVLAVALWMSAVGVHIEIGQLFVAGRSSEFADLGVDAAGIVLGCAAYRAWEAVRR